MEAALVRKTFLFEKRFGDLIHRYLVVFIREEMSVAIHGDLQGCVTGESLHHLGCKIRPRSKSTQRSVAARAN